MARAAARGARLGSTLEWAAGHAPDLNATERAFLADSRAASERSQRRLRAVLAGVATLLALAVVAGVVALDQRGNARDQALAADAQRLGSRALAENDLDLRLLLARQGVALDDSVQTRGNLLAALVEAPAAIGVLRGDGQQMWTIALSPDERTLAAGDPSGEVFLFDTRAKRRIGSFKPWNGNAWITQLAFSPDGRRLAIAHDTATGNALAVADLRSRRVVLRLQPRRGQFIGGLHYTRDGTLDVVGVPADAEGPSYFERFDARTGRRLLGPEPVNRAGRSPLQLTSDGRMVTAAEGEIVLRQAATFRRQRSFPIGRPASPWIGATALSPDDRTVAIGGEEGDVRLLDLGTGRVRAATGRHTGPVSAAHFTPDGRNLIRGGEDGRVIVWDVRQATAAETLSGHANGVGRLAITDDGETLYSSSLDGTVLIWDLVGRARLGRPFKTGPPEGSIPALSPDDRLLATGQLDGTISVVDLKTYALRTLPALTAGPIARVAFVPGSRLLVATGFDGFLALVDVDSGRVVRRLEGHRAGTFLPGISDDGRLLAIGSDDKTVGFWSLPEGRRVGARLRLRGYELWNAQLSPDGGRLVATVSDDDVETGRVEVYDTRSRRLVRRLKVAVPPGPVRFSRDGRLMAIGYRDGSVDVWSTQNWERVSPSLPSDGSGISDASFSADGGTLATGSETGSLRLWDVKTGQAIGSPLPGVSSVGVTPRFTRDGQKLIAAYDTGRAYAWDIRSPSLLRQACAVAGRRLTRAEWERFLAGRDYDPVC